MKAEFEPQIQRNRLSQKDFDRLSKFIYDNFGINLGNHKRIMLESRLQKRIKNLGIESFSDYTDYLFSPDGMKNEILMMIDVVTTNKTDFFREPSHFDALRSRILPEMLYENGSGSKHLKFWSAGCSTGEEPYTLAMVLQDFKESNPSLSYSILATDLSTTALQKAAQAVYDIERVNTIPLNYKKRYLLKNKDKTKKLVRIIPDLRNKVEFRRFNLLDNDYGIQDQKHIIFCRNVIIYFDRKTQEKVINNLVSYLLPGGYFISGHSETLSGMNIPIKQIAPTIYRKTG